jgi:ribosome-binding factor A
MPREFSRSARLADQIQRDLSDLIRLEVRDPRVGLVTVTEVEVSRDLSHAKVYVTSLAGSEHAAHSVQALQHAAGFLRSRLAQSLRARTVPELHFVYDESVERGVKLSRLIDQAVEAAPSASDEPAGKLGG